MTERNPKQGDAAQTERLQSGSSEEPQAIGTILPGIEHIVVLMFENRSFDNMLGGLYPQKSTEDYDGLQKKKCIPSCSETDPSPVCTDQESDSESEESSACATPQRAQALIASVSTST